MLPSPAPLSTAEVARRLGVKPATVYAYVSRGLLRSRRNADGKGSLFDPDEVAAFEAGRQRTETARDSPPIHTGITLIDDGRLSYRGHDTCALSRTHPYESVVSLLWTGRLDDVALPTSPSLLALVEAVTAPLPATARLTDRLRVAVAAAAAADPLRFDTSPAAVQATGRTLLGTMVATLPPQAPSAATVTRLAERLWPRLTASTPTPERLGALNAALVLLADHDIAASTLAVRVAASVRAHPYAVVGAGLAAHDGPLHGAASGLAYALIQDALARGSVHAISDRLRTGGPLPGFGHPLYPDGDPRARVLLARLHDLHDLPDHGRTRSVIDDLASTVRQRSGGTPNVDFAVAALAIVAGMGSDAGEAIFAIARTAGWIAHALEEYTDAPNRFRPLGRHHAHEGSILDLPGAPA